MKQRGMIRYLHMGCGESLAVRQLQGLVLEEGPVIRQLKSVKTGAVEKRRKSHEEQR